MKRIAIATTGGDAPGMNAAIRALTRLGEDNGLQVIGYLKGFEGIYNNSHRVLTKRDVGGILSYGGTILQTSRSDALRTPEGRKRCVDNLRSNDVDGIILIGGNGSFRGGQILSDESDIQVIGIPATIDNDVYGSDETIGFDTAVNTAIHQIDKIRDTATSHNRIFITEVMGRESGHIALDVGIAVGAEVILIPERTMEPEMIYEIIKENIAKGKKSGIIVYAEGVGDCRELATQIEENTNATVRINVLGYTQRGGRPTARSRLLANLFSKEAIELLLNGESDKVVILQDGNITSIPLEEASNNVKKIDEELLEYYRILAS